MTAGVGAATVFTDLGGLNFTLTDGTTDFGAGASFTITVPATNVTLTSGWKGASANDLIVEIIQDESVGVTFTVVQPTGGLVNPDVTAALNSVGQTWETMALNAQNIEDTTTLDLFKTWGEGRWGELMHKPCIVFTGVNDASVDTATAVCQNRQTDRVNAQLVAPGSVNLPFVIAARQLARIVKVANDNPPTGYNAEKASGLLPGEAGVQWDYLSRDIAVKRGSSTVEVVDGVVNIGDVVTFWRPTGEEPPAFRYVCDIVKLQNILFNLQLIFAAKEWAAAPLIPDIQVTTNPKARKPKSAIAAVNALIDNLGLAAIVSDPKACKKLTTAVIDSQNPKRLNVGVKVSLSGNTLIKDVGLKFGFYFGQAAAA
jgi:phage tail sheath gpL-like